MFSKVLGVLLTVFLVCGAAQATPVNIFPGIEVAKGDETSTSQILAIVAGICGPTCTSLYKQDAGGPESGTFAGSYATVFNGDLSGGSITWDGLPDPWITSASAYLLVKDGNHSPSWYLFNLAGWNGQDTITLSGFWPEQGAISHVDIIGPPGTSVPEPSSLLLLGSGLLGLGVFRRFRSA